MDQRLMFIADLIRQEHSFSALCRQYGISRTTGYKWQARYLEDGPQAFVQRASVPHTHPNGTPKAIVDLLLEARRAHPTWGARKLKVIVQRRYPGLDVPAASTIGSLLKRHGLIQGRHRVRRDRPPSNPRVHVEGPNDCWCFDFKGQFRLGDRSYCFPLTAIDAHSRYLLCCEGLPDVKGQTAAPAFRRVFQDWGLPRAILTDCGAPFASTSFSGLTELSAWWIALGIQVHRSRPGSPQDNGRLERLHKTLKAETTKPPRHTMKAQQNRFDAFQQEYNQIRPHEALDQDVPASRYHRSPRPFPRKLLKPEYPADSIVKSVRKNGIISYGGYNFTVSHVLRGKRVALLHTHIDGVLAVRFYTHTIGELNLRTGTFSNGNVVKALKKPKPTKIAPTLLQQPTKL